MALTEQTVLINVLKYGIEKRVPVVQADTGRSIRCEIEDWTIPDGATAKVWVKKPSAAIVYNACDIDTDTNSVLIELTNQMIAEAGLSKANVEITSNGEYVTAFQFGLLVKSKVSGGTESTNESTALEAMLDELAAEAKDALEQATAATEAANSATATAEETLQTANEAAEAAATSASEAAASEKAASSSETNAKTSEEAASASAESASDSATLSESWAIGGTGTRDGEDTDNSKYYAEQSAGSAGSASASAKSATTSETNAAASAESAKDSATEAAELLEAFTALGLSLVDGEVCQTYESEEE